MEFLSRIIALHSLLNIFVSTTNVLVNKIEILVQEWSRKCELYGDQKIVKDQVHFSDKEKSLNFGVKIQIVL